MSYQELKGLFYEDSARYALEYNERFHSEEAVAVDFYVGDNQAFFLQNAEVMTLAYRIAKIDKKIEGICSELPGVALSQYSRKCLIDETVLTNRIEGVHSSRKEIIEVLDTLEAQSKAKGKHVRFLGLVNKYLKLIQGEDIPLKSSRDVRALYDEVFLREVIFEDASNKPDGDIFRKEAVAVHSETDKVIHKGLMPEHAIIEAMEKGLRFLNDPAVEELFRVCLFHYMIEYIHPFYDGNGRLGRLILSYGISKTLCPIVAFRISETIKENISAYYRAFKTCNDPRNRGDLTPFLLMQLTMIYQAMQELERSLREKRLTWKKYEAVMEPHCQNDPILRKLYSYLIQAALFSEKGISMAELVAHMGVSKYVINKKLSQMDPVMIVLLKKGNSKYYAINLSQLDRIILRDGAEKISP